MLQGRSKKLAKLNLAKTILLCMYDIHDFKEHETAPKNPKPQTEEQIFEKKFPMTQLKEMLGEIAVIWIIMQYLILSVKLVGLRFPQTWYSFQIICFIFII